MERTGVRTAERKRIALVAHDNLKGEMYAALMGGGYERILRDLGRRHAAG